jgi:hypothetical protein
MESQLQAEDEARQQVQGLPLMEKARKRKMKTTMRARAMQRAVLTSTRKNSSASENDDSFSARP